MKDVGAGKQKALSLVVQKTPLTALL